MKVLVTCASPHGSTRGIAERIAARLREDSLAVDCVTVDEAPAVSAYDAVVVGSAIHDQAWLPEAAGFVSTRADDLLRRPVWLFSVGMPDALARPLRGLAQREGPAVVAPLADLVHPVDTRLFTGVVDARDLPPGGRVALRVTGGRFGDFRDWPAIDAWSAAIAAHLREAAPSGQPTTSRR